MLPPAYLLLLRLLQSLPAAFGSWHAGGQLQRAATSNPTQKDRQADSLTHKCCGTPVVPVEHCISKDHNFLIQSTPCVSSTCKNTASGIARLAQQLYAADPQPCFPSQTPHPPSPSWLQLLLYIQHRRQIRPFQAVQITPLTHDHLAAAAPPYPALQTMPPKSTPPPIRFWKNPAMRF